MSRSQVSAPLITASDRLGFALFLAIVLHAIVVLGVGFKPSSDAQAKALPSLEVIVANTKTVDETEDPDFLAQVDQAGGGNSDRKARPGAPASTPTPIDQKGLSDQQRAELRQQQLKLNQIYYLTQQVSDSVIDTQAQRQSKSTDHQQADTSKQRATRIARLQAEIREMAVAYAKRPRTITLTASTRKAVEASYLASWVKKVERAGNLNYPVEARRLQLDGHLSMSVWLNASGEVLDARINNSSGFSVLDEAAKRILRIAQPFPPFPEELREQADQSVIIRTWDFKSKRFKTKSGVS